MPIILDRSICCDLNATIEREWFISNNLGGYAAGTVAGTLTRTQHGLLAAIPPTANVPHVLLAKIDEEVDFDQRAYHLGTNEYRDGTLNPAGFVHLEHFRLEEGFPIFTYRLGGIDGIMLEKRIWMPQGENTTYIQYRVLRTATQTSSRKTGPLRSGPLRSTSQDESKGPLIQMTLLPFSAYRPYNQAQSGNRHFQVEVHTLDIGNSDARRVAGCTIKAGQGAYPYHILAVGHPESQITCIPTGVWYWHFLHRKEAQEGKIDDFYLPGVIRATLWPGEESTLTVVVSIEDLSTLPLHTNQLQQSYQESVERQQELTQSILQPGRYFGESGEAMQAHHLQVLPLATTSDPHAGGEEYLSQLLQAGDRFLTRRPYVKRPPDVFFHRTNDITALHAGYYDMEVRPRDALIALPGLTLVTERYDEALRLLREFAHHFRSGLLPDCLPMGSIDDIDQSQYRSADTTLWYFYALDYYLRVTQNYQFLEEFFHPLTHTINSYVQGTFNGIRVDPRDGLLYAGEPGKAATWMNAMIDGKPVTPRRGKAVEINALWYHALSLMYEWSQYLNHVGYLSYSYHTSYYQELRTLCKESFQQRFWYDRGQYLYDVVDGPTGDDPSLRPNQIFALSLRHRMLKQELWQSVFEAVTQHLLTPYGLRTLSPEETAYRGRMGEDQRSQRAALHQGCVWAWLIGPYIEAMMTVRCGPMEKRPDHYLCREYLWRKGICLLEPFRDHLKEGLLGVNRSVFDGASPHQADENSISAPSTGELLRLYSVLSQMRVTEPVFSHILRR